MALPLKPAAFSVALLTGAYITCALQYCNRTNIYYVTCYKTPHAETKTWNLNKEVWPLGYKNISCSTQLRRKFFLLINVKMPTIVGILTFLSRKKNNSIQGLSEPEKSLISLYFYPYEHLKLSCSAELGMTIVYNLWAWSISPILLTRCRALLSINPAVFSDTCFYVVYVKDKASSLYQQSRIRRHYYTL